MKLLVKNIEEFRKTFNEQNKKYFPEMAIGKTKNVVGLLSGIPVVESNLLGTEITWMLVSEEKAIICLSDGRISELPMSLLRLAQLWA